MKKRISKSNLMLLLAATGLGFGVTNAGAGSMPSSTDWQAWNSYMSTPKQPSAVSKAPSLPSSTNWQAWNDYVGNPSERQYSQRSYLPSSTNWQAWNEYIGKASHSAM